MNDQITLTAAMLLTIGCPWMLLQHLVYGREVHDWDRKLLRQNVAPTDETRISNRRIVCLLQNLCHPSVAPSGGKHRYIVGSNSTESSYMVLEAKRLYNCFLDKYISCLRSYCSAMVDLGRGMYAHEVRELKGIVRRSSNDTFLIFNNNKGTYKPQMLSTSNQFSLGQ